VLTPDYTATNFQVGSGGDAPDPTLNAARLEVVWKV
jgi:hypothetical protein